MASMQTIKITRSAAIQSMTNLGLTVSPGILPFTLADALASRLSHLDGIRYVVEIVSVVPKRPPVRTS